MLKIKQRVWRLSVKLASYFPKNSTTAKSFRRSQSLAHRAAQTKGETVNDLALIKRIVEAYSSSSSNEEDRGDSMWQVFFNQHHLPIHQVFKERRIDEAANILRNPGSTELFYGFDNLTTSIQAMLSTNSESLKNHAGICLDNLIRVVEAMGAIRLDNPERYHVDPPVVWEADQVIEQIEKKWGHKLTFPNPYPHEHGVWSSRGVISYRAVHALYQAWRIKQLLKNVRNPRVLEIGAGLGRTAYFARQLGITDYTIIDLPFTLLSSGYFLGRTLGAEKVAFLQEKPAQLEDCIKLLPPDEFFKSQSNYDLIINVDSLPEMDPSIAQAYWHQIETRAKIFMSINHEGHKLAIKELIERSSKIEECERYPYWLRTGFVEEIVKFIR